MKSETEKKFDRLCKEYRAKFGKNYPLLITDSRPLTVHIAELEKCLKNDKESKQEKMDKDVVY